MPGARSASQYSKRLPTLCVGGLLACLLVPYAAYAKPTSSDRNQLIIDSFVKSPANPSDSEAAQGGVRPVTDIALGGSGMRGMEPGNPVADMMQAQFAAAGRPRASRTSFRNVRARAGAAPPMPPLRQAPVATGAEGTESTCQAYPYRATNILKPENEAYRRVLLPYVVHEACAAGIPAGLLDALIIQESRYNALAISTKGAIGLTQLMPGTANKLGANAWSVEDNIRGGATYLRTMMDTFGGQAHLALAAYNAGPGAVTRYGGIPAFHETQGYVAGILGLWGYLSQ